MSFTERNWKIVGLTKDNFVICEVDGKVQETQERPSEYLGIEYLSRRENGILRRGVTSSGKDRKVPKE